MKTLGFGMAAALALAVSVTSTRAAAEEPPPAVAEQRARLVLDAAAEGLDVEALRAAIARELGVEVALARAGVEGRGTVRVRTQARRATVSFASDASAPVERVVDLPRSAATSTEMIALLVGNLVRDEASALVDELRARAGSAGPAAGSAGAEAAAAPPPAAVAPAAAAAPTPAPVAATRSTAGRSVLDPCKRAVGPWPVGVDVVPFVGTSSLERGRSSTRVLSLGLASDYGAATQGADVAGAASIVGDGMCGAQVAGALSLSLGQTKGTQIAGGVSLSLGAVRGAQLAPVSIATAGVQGAQLGVVNVSTEEVNGAQVGLVNIARRADAQVGLVSIQSEGKTYVEGTISEASIATVSVVHGGRKVHNVYGVGMRAGAAGARLVSVLGIGVRLIDESKWTFDIDALSMGLVRPSSMGTWSMQAQLRTVVGYRATDVVSVFLGPTLNVLVTEDATERAQTPIPLSLDTSSGATLVRGWTGALLGVRVLD